MFGGPCFPTRRFFVKKRRGIRFDIAAARARRGSRAYGPVRDIGRQNVTETGAGSKSGVLEPPYN
jgi:hypothetical protein